MGRRLIIGYGLFLAAGALLLAWLESQFIFERFSLEYYVFVLALLFTGLGLWLGVRLSRRKAPAGFEVNRRALRSLEISEREHDVLTLLAAGHSNQEIADKLFISPNTVKTHLKSLYQKLDVARRGQAVDKARSLRLVA